MELHDLSKNGGEGSLLDFFLHFSPEAKDIWIYMTRDEMIRLKRTVKEEKEGIVSLIEENVSLYTIFNLLLKKARIDTNLINYLYDIPNF